MAKVVLLVAVSGAVLMLPIAFDRDTRGTTIEGRVFFERVRDAYPSGPVRDAEVTTDRGEGRTVTDEGGGFRLHLPNRIAKDEFVVLTVRAGDRTVRKQFVGADHVYVDVVLADFKAPLP
jgi:hypothetical protein